MAQYAITEHEYSLNNGSTWTTCTSGMDNGNGTGTIPVGNLNISIGSLQVRVKASGNRPAGAILSNSVAFTLASGGGSGSDYKLIIDGNSHFASNNLQTYVTDALPAYMTAHNVPETFTSVVNFAVAGQSTQDMAADAATQIDAAFDNTKTKNVLLVWEATNDIYTNNLTGQQAYDNIKSYCQARKTANPTLAIAVGTVMPRSNSGTPAGYEAARVDFNTLLRAAKAANETWLDAIADIAAEERFRDAGDELNNNYFSSDQVHLTDTGRAILAPIFARAILKAGFGVVFTDYEKATTTTISSTKITQTGDVITANNTTGGYGHTGYFQYALPANQDGGFIFKVAAGDEDAIIGFSTTNGNTPYGSMAAAVWRGGTTLYAVNSGGTGSTSNSIPDGSLLKIYRESGIFKVYLSADNGATWGTSIYQFTTTSTAKLYLVADLSTNARATGIRVIGMEQAASTAPAINWAGATQLHISGTSTGVNEVNESNNVLTAAPGAGGEYSAKEIFNIKLPANTAGWIGYIIDTAQGDGIIGFLPTNVAAGYQGMITGGFNSGTAGWKVDGGSPLSSGGVATGDILIIYRDAAGVFTLFSGPIGGTLLQLGNPFTTVNAGEIFVGCNIEKNGKISNPRGSGLITA
jgi:lysophospholipase L1-like esterase